MKIYTRTGDDGTTGLLGGDRIGKADARVEAYGTVDEANALLGVVRAMGGLSPAVEAVLDQIQHDLFVLGAELACVPGKESKLSMALLGPADVLRLEQAIDDADALLEPLQNFILPGGSPAAAALHAARTVARRAERRILAASSASALRPDLLRYVNRLSDLLFVLARRVNREAGVVDVPWKARGA